MTARFALVTARQTYVAAKVVIASGGLSLPKIATDLAFRTANRLGLNVVSPRAALVPLTWNSSDSEKYQMLSGISLDAVASCNGVSFRESILFTHRGLSGPAILQISSYWREGEAVTIDLLPDTDAADWLDREREARPQQRIVSLLKTRLPKRFVDTIADDWFQDMKIGSCSPTPGGGTRCPAGRMGIQARRQRGLPHGRGHTGRDRHDEVSSKTFEVKKVPGLYAIGEALDVTGWLGGYNFQWAWASGWCCAQHLDPAIPGSE